MEADVDTVRRKRLDIRFGTKRRVIRGVNRFDTRDGLSSNRVATRHPMESMRSCGHSIEIRSGDLFIERRKVPMQLAC